jgi:ATP-binding cassette subfamily B protein
VGFIFVTIYAVSVYWGIALAYALTVPVVGGLSLLLSRRLKAVQQAIVTETAALAGSTTESLRNIELVKSLGLAGQEVSRLGSVTEKILALELKKLRYVRSISFIQGSVINFLRTAILLFMMVLIYLKVITFGEFFSLFVYSFFVFGPLQEIGTVINTNREAEASLARYREIMHMEKEREPENPKPIGPVSRIGAKDVSFTYPSSEEAALRGVSFEATQGKTIAFVGPSGSGKSSLVKLLVGLYQPQSGVITYNGIPGGDASLGELRSQIGFVTQETQLFAGTIRENLLFVNPEATDEDCLRALEKSASNSILARGGNGLDSVIGEGGVRLSGGEKQRLSIARALLRNPAILVFDEATSSLDSITEQEITGTMRSITASGDHIIVMIAHRLSTVMHADMIYVLEKGTVAESGTLGHGGLYAAMWRQQIGERA